MVPVMEISQRALSFGAIKSPKNEHFSKKCHCALSKTGLDASVHMTGEDLPLEQNCKNIKMLSMPPLTES